MDTLTIGRLAERAGVGVETIRFYERERLIPEPTAPVPVTGSATWRPSPGLPHNGPASERSILDALANEP